MFSLLRLFDELLTEYLNTPKLLSHLNDTKLNKALKQCMLEIFTMQKKIAVHSLLAYIFFDNKKC